MPKCAYFPVSISDLPKPTSLKSILHYTALSTCTIRSYQQVGWSLICLRLICMALLLVGSQGRVTALLIHSMVHGQHKQNGTRGKNEQRTLPCDADTSLYPHCFGARQKRKQDLAVQMRASLITGSTESPKGASLSRMDSFHGTRSFHGHPQTMGHLPSTMHCLFHFYNFSKL